MGLESVDPDSLKSAHKAFNKPADYGRILERMARHDIYAITSFIVGLDGDRPGTAARLEAEIAKWPPVLPVFGLLTPFPATPLYDKLKASGRLLRPTHWLESGSFKATFQPEGFTTESFEAEMREAWTRCYRPRTFARTQRWLVERGKGLDPQITYLVSRLLFRGIYFQTATPWAWVRLLGANLPTIANVVVRALFRKGPRRERGGAGGRGPALRSSRGRATRLPREPFRPWLRQPHSDSDRVPWRGRARSRLIERARPHSRRRPGMSRCRPKFAPGRSSRRSRTSAPRTPP